MKPKGLTAPSQRRNSGFTLIEVMVVVIILGILAAFVVPNVFDAPGKARKVQAKSDIQAIESALNLYRLDNYRYPTTEQGLEALVSKPSSGPEVRNYAAGGYLPRVPLDPWKNAYRYLSPGQHGDYDVYSLGSDNAPGGEGEAADIGNWNMHDAAAGT